MGDKWIWIYASIGYGVLTALIYSFLCHLKGAKGFIRRCIIWSLLFTAFGLIVCRILWAIFAI